MYCPNAGGSCSNGGATTIGLLSRWDWSLQRIKGPKVGVFKAFVDNHL